MLSSVLMQKLKGRLFSIGIMHIWTSAHQPIIRTQVNKHCRVTSPAAPNKYLVNERRSEEWESQGESGGDLVPCRRSGDRAALGEVSCDKAEGESGAVY